MFEELNQHRAAVAENIQKACEIGFTGNELEKAHKVGDIHPNGKWVWTQLPSGRYDWRVIKKTAQPAAATGGASSNPAKKNASSNTDKNDWKKMFENEIRDLPIGTVISMKDRIDGKTYVFTKKGENDWERTSTKDGYVDTKWMTFILHHRDSLEQKIQKPSEKKGADEKKEAKVSPFVSKTLQTLKAHFRRNWSEGNTQRIQAALVRNEEVAKKIMNTTFPAASWSIGGGKSVKLSDSEELVFRAHASTDTTSRNPAFRGGTDYHYSIIRKVGDSEKVIASSSHSSGSKWTTASEAKNDCKIDALVKCLQLGILIFNG